jgi:hypothetical protein
LQLKRWQTPIRTEIVLNKQVLRSFVPSVLFKVAAAFSILAWMFAWPRACGPDNGYCTKDE